MHVWLFFFFFKCCWLVLCLLEGHQIFNGRRKTSKEGKGEMEEKELSPLVWMSLNFPN